MWLVENRRQTISPVWRPLIKMWPSNKDNMNHLQLIQTEFLKESKEAFLKPMVEKLLARLDKLDQPRSQELDWWNSLSPEKRKRYLQRHPQSRLKFATAWEDLSLRTQLSYLRQHPKSRKEPIKRRPTELPDQIAIPLDLIYEGYQPEIGKYIFSDPITQTSISASSTEEAKQKIESSRQLFGVLAHSLLAVHRARSTAR